MLWVAGLVVLVGASCPIAPSSGRVCNGHGRCTILSECECDAISSGFDCSQMLCPRGLAWAGDAIGVDQIHVPVECSNRGTCDRAHGKCVCDVGFTGIACDKLVACFSECSHSGTCVTMMEYAENNSPYGYTYTNVWDSTMIRGCVCDAGATEADCSKQACPMGDDPMTTGQMNEKQLLRCTGTGTFQLQFKGKTTRLIPSTASVSDLMSSILALGATGALSITFSTGNQVCLASGQNIVSIEFISNFGPQPPYIAQMVNSQGVLQLTGGTVTIATAGGTLGVYSSVAGTKEYVPCSNRGYCSSMTGVCSCYLYPMPGFRSSNGYGAVGIRGDCGAPDNTNYYGGPIKGCPGYLPCSGHGVCSGSPAFACRCAAGWTSGDCSLRTCPKGYSWFNLPASSNIAHQMLQQCSNAGTCDPTTGECTCFPPFMGPACEFRKPKISTNFRQHIVKCPIVSERVCSGHGVCLTLSELAMATTIDGVSAGFSYGATPNNPLTWDALKIKGCKCDPGFFGYDCNFRKCPTGDDPSTMGQMNAVQQITCRATGGVFQLGFRGEYSDYLPFDSDADDVQDALLNLPTIHGIDVQFTQLGACINGNTMTITFTQDFGNLPLLQFVGSSLSLVVPSTVSTLVRGTKEDAVCSNHGTCDTTTGICSCGLGYTSSDGNGKPGTRQDCGYVKPFH
ncbi:hypothetical protein THRCLA_05219 [Thraustotheca clavata]|uniref:EGF-like domain-containing protein n=1 Tax=Thraustotheca clavata TaxID=74557 RepID=A0A1V9ZWN0_9STRA|nr:hypothetical protein THRCLA_05219 [Thraustotheca clavata]